MSPSEPTRDLLKPSHTPDAIRARLKEGYAQSYLRDFVYGGIDGAVTTFAVVSGVAGAELSTGILLVLGLANLLGDGFSMAASNFLGSRAELQLLERARKSEEHHIEVYPEGEREEIRQILANKGFAGEDLDRATEIITSDRKLWVDTMLQEELGLSLEKPHPFWAALTTFVSFMTIGIIPLLIFFVDFLTPVNHAYLISTLLTAFAFVSVGAVKSRFVAQRWYLAGMETLTVGGIAAGLAYAVGVLLKGWIE